jgi:hypothetical protein
MQLTKRKAKQFTQDDIKILWRARNRWAIPAVAKQLGISVSFVRLVFLGKNQSEGGRVEKRLAELGCPGFEAYNGVHKDGAGRLDDQQLTS